MNLFQVGRVISSICASFGYGKGITSGWLTTAITLAEQMSEDKEEKIVE